MSVDVVVGLQRGDEGKGRFVDTLMPEYDIGARYSGGDNAGHTVVDETGEVYKLHGLPSSIVHQDKLSVIGSGAVVNAVRLGQEMETLQNQGVEVNEDNLLISGGTHLILPHHILEDEKRESGRDGQGSTKSGIAQVYRDKAARIGVRAEIINNDPDELFDMVYEGLRNQRGLMSRVLGERSRREDKETAQAYLKKARELGKYVTDTSLFLNQQLKQGANVLAEGAQAFLLDIDQGMYPYVTSASTTAGGVPSGLGVSPENIGNVTGVAKAIQSHVGKGTFVTEVHDPERLSRLHGDKTSVDAECGTTTGRTRRLGNLDLAQIRRANIVNGTNEIALTKLDWVPRYGDTVQICTAYSRKGKTLPIAPDADYKLQESVPIYETLPTWEEDISHIREFEDLPENAQDYIKFIEEETGLPITMIGIGPARDQMILRK